jgi:hypothetical protein
MDSCHGVERRQSGSEEGLTVTESSFLLEGSLAGLGLGGAEAAAAFEQGHLGREVGAFADLDLIVAEGETDVVTASVAARSNQPEGLECVLESQGGCRHSGQPFVRITFYCVHSVERRGRPR